MFIIIFNSSSSKTNYTIILLGSFHYVTLPTVTAVLYYMYLTKTNVKKNFKSIKIYYEFTKPFSTKQPPDDTLHQHYTPNTTLGEAN